MESPGPPLLMAFALYLDDDFGDNAVFRGLNERGFDVIRATDIGMRGATDAAHLAHANGLGRVIASANRGDFLRLHRDWMNMGAHHSGIVLVAQQEWSVGELLRRFVRLLEVRTPATMVDSVEFLSSWGRDR
jgi:hypothetical protein